MSNLHHFCNINGSILPYQDKMISPFDLGFNRSYAIFDFFRSINGHIRFKQDHLKRFINSAKLANLELTYSYAELSTMLDELLRKNDAQNAWFRMTLSGGLAYDFSSPQKPSLVILSGAFNPPKPSCYVDGIKLITKRYVREEAEIKTTNYFFVLKHFKEMKSANATDILYYDDFISETSRANLFAVKDNVIYTPAHNILKGITRKNILKLRPDIISKDLPLSFINDCDEIFITSSSKAIMPVTQINDLKIGNGEVGPVSKTLKNEFDLLT